MEALSRWVLFATPMSAFLLAPTAPVAGGSTIIEPPGQPGLIKRFVPNLASTVNSRMKSLNSHGDDAWAPAAAAAAVGKCGRCGCRLSRYRAPEEECCWACAHPHDSDSRLSESEDRIALFLSGRSLHVIPAAVFVCPTCGDLKSEGARRCARCHFTAPHPKKVASGELKSGPCPICGERKNANARLCRTCWAVDQRLLFAGNPALTCPDCGGPKVRKAEFCRKCHDHRLFGTVYLNGRPLSSICPDCGGPKKLKRAKRCRVCAIRYRSAQPVTT